MLDSIYLTRDTVRCARLAAGGLLQCVDCVLTDQAGAGWAVVRPPGHHAEHSSSAGFCIINNVAVAARWTRVTRDSYT